MSMPAAVPHRPRTRLVHGENSPLVDLVRSCIRIASSDATVLLTGETGTGKEVFARLIHEHSDRADKTLVPVNCGAIPESLLESELFGYVRGAFTGAVTSRKGRVALAEGGTLFLDEIGEMPLALQVKLLRLLQEKTYQPVGCSESVTANFRLIAATNRDLQAEVEAGRFRRDLYYRLLVCPVELPPLRRRVGDVEVLFRHFWNERGETRRIDPAVWTVLAQHSWPGNVRELENLVERLSVCAEGPVIRVEDLPPGLIPAEQPAHLTLLRDTQAPAPAAANEGDDLVLPPPGQAIDLPALLRRLENRYIDAALANTGGNKKAAADLLGLQRTTLVEKLRRRREAEPEAVAQ